MKTPTHYFFKLLMLSVCLHGNSAVFAPLPAEEQPKKSYFSAQNRFLATTGAVVATPVALALREAALKACAQTPKNKDQGKYYQALTKNFFKNITSVELWKRHFLRLYAAVACFSKRKPKETHRAWAVRTKKSLTLYAQQNPVHATVLALWAVNFVGTTLHIGYTTTHATTEGIKQWMQAFTLDPHKKPKESSTPIPVTLDFAQHPEGATEESGDAPEAAPQTAGGKLQKIAEFIPVTTSVRAYFSAENREHARDDVRAWLKALQAHPLGTHILTAAAANQAHPYLAELGANVFPAGSPRDLQCTDEHWQYSQLLAHLVTIPVHILAQADPQNDAHVDTILGLAHVLSLGGAAALPIDAFIMPTAKYVIKPMAQGTFDYAIKPIAKYVIKPATNYLIKQPAKGIFNFIIKPAAKGTFHAYTWVRKSAPAALGFKKKKTKQ